MILFVNNDWMVLFLLWIFVINFNFLFEIFIICVNGKKVWIVCFKFLVLFYNGNFILGLNMIVLFVFNVLVINW